MKILKRLLGVILFLPGLYVVAISLLLILIVKGKRTGGVLVNKIEKILEGWFE